MGGRRVEGRADEGVRGEKKLKLPQAYFVFSLILSFCEP